MRVRSGKPWVLFLLLLALSGCSRDLGDNELTWHWGWPPLLFLGLGGLSWIVWHRKRQLARWDLRTDPVPPDGRKTEMAFVGLAASAVLVFAALNFIPGGIDKLQGLKNSFFWLVGTVSAVGIAVFWGGRLGERGYPKRESENG